MPGRFRSIPAEGACERYDGANVPDIEAFAPGQYQGTDRDGHPVVRSPQGDLYTLRPGWVLSRKDGADLATLRDPWAWADSAEEIP